MLRQNLLKFVDIDLFAELFLHGSWVAADPELPFGIQIKVAGCFNAEFGVFPAVFPFFPDQCRYLAGSMGN